MALSKWVKVFYVAVGVAMALQAAYADDIEWVNTRPETRGPRPASVGETSVLCYSSAH
jgi:hypothetical protein